MKTHSYLRKNCAVLVKDNSISSRSPFKYFKLDLCKNINVNFFFAHHVFPLLIQLYTFFSENTIIILFFLLLSLFLSNYLLFTLNNQILQIVVQNGHRFFGRPSG